jgi:Tfp pilus assembly protein PilE
MLGLTKIEKTALVIIFAALFGLMSISYGNSLRKARDVQRKSDIQDIANALEKFQKVFSYYPQSVNGKIVGCNPQKDTTGGINLSV